ncbi:transcription initiation factor TFIID subunit 1 [Aplysia californica]|uniref:Transcription initiation factor TFIID subunit 1 n=1 Tax=Aplysia californica TaxID=6500 RepID=A0ABM0K3B7_APLCA|nr:transcription initiation factor TFIID subunit 1 [Aplysia californica]
MGANQSNGDDVMYHAGSSGQFTRAGHYRVPDGHKKSKAKPGPPPRPTVTSVTHSSAHISWAPPRHTHGHDVIAYTVEMCGVAGGGNSDVIAPGDREWRVLTKNCQSTRYDARYLTPDSAYTFRVRAENVYGTGKPSAPSEPATTKMFESQTDPSIGVDADQTSYGLENGVKVKDKSAGGLHRRHSFNMHLDGAVTSILNHSDIVLASPSPSSSFSSTLAHDRSERSGSLTRHHVSRTSLTSGRKSATPIMLPGTGTDSLNRLRESRNSLRASTSDYGVSSTIGREPGKTRFRESRSSIGSSISDIQSPASIAGDESRKRQRGSRGSLRSSTSDLTVSHSNNGGSSSNSNSREGSLCDCSAISDSYNHEVGHALTNGDSHRDRRHALTNGDSHRDGRHALSNGDSHRDGRHALTNGDSHRSERRSEEYPVHYHNVNNNNNNNNKYNNICNNVSSHSASDVIGDYESCKLGHNDIRHNDDTRHPNNIGVGGGDDDDDDDDIARFKEGLRKLDLQDGKLKLEELRDKLRVSDVTLSGSDVTFSQCPATRGYYDSLENPWERVTSPDGVSQRILAAPFCDDIKMALYARNLSDGEISLDSHSLSSSSNHSAESDNEAGDFRTLRSVLQSNNMLVKTSRAQPELMGVVMADTGEARVLTRGRLTTIVDADEEDETVRVTTL